MTILDAAGMRVWGLRALVAMLCVAAWANAASAQTWTVVQVEEDWELVLGTPDPGSTGPQVICTMSPAENLDSYYFTFEVNHHTIPDFVSGGLQLEVWNGESLVAEQRGPNQGVLSQAGETIRWTQKMSLNGGQVTFEILNGTSTTWGNFGGLGYLKASASIGLSSLNSYRPSVSVENSGVSYAANRVQSLVLKEVRYKLSTGEEYADATPRAVYPK